MNKHAMKDRSKPVAFPPFRAAATTDLRRAIVEVGWSPRRPNQQYWQLLAAAPGIAEALAQAVGM